MTNRYSVAREHIVPENEHAFETSLKMSTIKNMVWSGWPKPDKFDSLDIYWPFPDKLRKTTRGYLYSSIAGTDPTYRQMIFFEITLTSQRKNGPWPPYDYFEMQHIDWHDENQNKNPKAERTGTLSQSGTPGNVWSVYLKSVAYGPSNYTQLNESMKLVFAKK